MAVEERIESRKINWSSKGISAIVVPMNEGKKIENIHYAISRANRDENERIPRRLVSKVANIADIFTLAISIFRTSSRSLDKSFHTR